MSASEFGGWTEDRSAIGAATHPRLLDRLAESPARAAAGAVSASAPPAGEWSAREAVLHLVAVEEEVWQPRLDSLAAPGSPTWSWIEPGLWSGPGSETLDGANTAFAAARAATVARLEGLDGAGWARHGLHATYGRLDVARLLTILIDHDEEHLAQIEALCR
jgi:hypothetical protein